MNGVEVEHKNNNESLILMMASLYSSRQDALGDSERGTFHTS